ncbi:hypothetical protein D3C87_1535110 [compost metagenome]
MMIILSADFEKSFKKQDLRRSAKHQPKLAKQEKPRRTKCEPEKSNAQAEAPWVLTDSGWWALIQVPQRPSLLQEPETKKSLRSPRPTCTKI